MKAVKIYLLLLVVVTAAVTVDAVNPFKDMFDGVKNQWRNILNPPERCDSDWISFNPSGLKFDLGNKLFGQHIASSVILKTVNGFMRDNDPDKPLVLSLHGRPGIGKNYVCQLIAENIYKKGMKSSFVHVFTADLHFPHTSKIEAYKSQLQEQIKGNVTNCPRSMFIFDEVEEMHPGLIDAIRPYLDHYHNLDGVSYQKAIFIFLSNAGGESITQTALYFWNDGRDRTEIELKDLETSLSVSAFNDNNGLRHSRLISSHLVDFFVPFLPLECQHVVQCVVAEMKARGLQPDLNVAKQVAEDLGFFPKTERVFSIRGCKTIKKRLNHYI